MNRPRKMTNFCLPPGDVLGWERYAYVENNPLRYTDPSGHYGCEDELCKDPETIWEAQRNVRLGTNGKLYSFGEGKVRTASAAEVYAVYVEFVNSGEWKNWTDNPNVDPLLVFLAIVLGREAYEEIFSYRYERSLANQEVYKQVAVGWFELWSNNPVTIEAYGAMQNHLDRRTMLFNWMATLESSRFDMATLLGPKRNEYMSVTKDFGIEVATNVYYGIGRNHGIEKDGNGWWPCWGNESVMPAFDTENKALYLFRIPDAKGVNAMYVLSASQTLAIYGNQE